MKAVRRKDVKPMNIQLPIVEQREIAADHYELVLPRVAPFVNPIPGQFLNIACRESSSYDPFLRRPFSFYRIDDDTFSVVYRVVGRGTAALSRYRPGRTIDLLGPLGNGYCLDHLEPSRRVLLVGGGVGVPPIFHLSQQLASRGIPFEVLVGFAEKRFVIGVEDWQDMGIEVRVATDDGSFGHHGYVTELLDHVLTSDVAGVFACGPQPMLVAVTAMAAQAGVNVQVSLEEWMGCGIGVCLSCVCTVHTEEGPQWERICYEGPVFDGRKVVWQTNG